MKWQIVWTIKTNLYRIFPICSKFFLNFSNVSRFFQIFPDFSKFFQIIPHYSKLFQIIPNWSKLFQFIPILSNLFQFILNYFRLIGKNYSKQTALISNFQLLAAKKRKTFYDNKIQLLEALQDYTWSA